MPVKLQSDNQPFLYSNVIQLVNEKKDLWIGGSNLFIKYLGACRWCFSYPVCCSGWFFHCSGYFTWNIF